MVNSETRRLFLQANQTTIELPDRIRVNTETPIRATVNGRVYTFSFSPNPQFGHYRLSIFKPDGSIIRTLRPVPNEEYLIKSFDSTALNSTDALIRIFDPRNRDEFRPSNADGSQFLTVKTGQYFGMKKSNKAP